MQLNIFSKVWHQKKQPLFLFEKRKLVLSQAGVKFSEKDFFFVFYKVEYDTWYNKIP